MTKTSIRPIQEIEYNWDVVINGKRVHPRYAYTSRDAWYTHLDSLGHKKITKALAKLNEHNKCGTRYRHLNEYLYSRFLELIPTWADDDA